MIEVKQGNQIRQIKHKDEGTVLSFLRNHGYGMTAVCSGNKTCGKCRVRILKGAPEASVEDREKLSAAQLKAGDRLACAHRICDGMRIELDEKRDYQGISTFSHVDLDRSAWTGPSDAYGIAIDLGTTTVAVGLVSLTEGKLAQLTTFLNPQSSYGADVISRIQSSKQVGVQVLQRTILERLEKEIESLCSLQGIETTALQKIAIAGNTTMLYLLQGFDPSELAVAPFTVSHSTYREVSSAGLFGFSSPAKVSLFPCLSAYVGGDIVAGIYAYEAVLREDQPALLLDLGTNGEIALLDGNQIVCAATAAGPAFEGAGIQCGVGGIHGAISEVRFSSHQVEVTTIGDEDPIGICGSGIIDLVAEGLRTGRIDGTGRMADGSLNVAEGQVSIVFTQKDVREVQLAKAAVAAGMRVLSDKKALKIDQIKRLYVAGGFGQHLNFEHAERIGLIPQGMEERTIAIGNASFAGAFKALFEENLEKALEQICFNSTYFELSKEKSFNMLYVQEMNFKKSE